MERDASRWGFESADDERRAVNDHRARVLAAARSYLVDLAADVFIPHDVADAASRASHLIDDVLEALEP